MDLLVACVSAAAAAASSRDGPDRVVRRPVDCGGGRFFFGRGPIRIGPAAPGQFFHLRNMSNILQQLLQESDDIECRLLELRRKKAGKYISCVSEFCRPNWVGS